jgi:hypothetical protein
MLPFMILKFSGLGVAYQVLALSQMWLSREKSVTLGWSG